MHIRLIEPGNHIRILDPARVIRHLDPLARQLLLPGDDRELIGIKRYGFHQILFQQIQKLIIGDLHRRGIVHHPVEEAHQHQGDQRHHQEDQDRRMIAVAVSASAVSTVIVVIVVFVHLNNLLFLPETRQHSASALLLQIAPDHIHASVDSDLTRIKRQMVGGHISPFFLCLEIVIGCLLLIRLYDGIPCLLL